MIEWIGTLKGYEQVLWIISIVSTVVFFIQILSTVIKKSPDKKRYTFLSYCFSFKNIAGFFSMFGWVSIASLYQGVDLATSLILGAFCGLVLMAVMAALYYYTDKLKRNETPEGPLEINSTGEVISEVGGRRTGLGKISVNIEGVNRIMEAMTDFEHNLKEGTKIRVESVTSTGIFMVKPLQ